MRHSSNVCLPQPVVECHLFFWNSKYFSGIPQYILLIQVNFRNSRNKYVTSTIPYYFYVLSIYYCVILNLMCISTIIICIQQFILRIPIFINVEQI